MTVLQGGRKRVCVRPAPWTPIRMSVDLMRAIWSWKGSSARSMLLMWRWG